MSYIPADPLALLDWAKPLRKWCQEHPDPIKGLLDRDDVIRLANTYLHD